MKKKILIVDDEEVLRRIMRTMLERRPFDVIEAANGAEGFDLARKEQPDLILLDWNMPGMNGADVLRALRAETLTAGIPVILLTGTDPQDLETQGHELTNGNYVLKPFSVLQLLEKVEKTLA
jgi:DNA-binding response OmpR family regulator